MAATATMALKIGVPGRVKPVKKAKNFTKLTVGYPDCSPSTSLRNSAIRALDSESEGGGNSSGSDNSGAGGYIAQEDVDYLLKLVAGSIAAGAAIKYGSIVFPEITKPNIIEALVMVLTPVATAVWLLIKQSRADRQS